ncbi:transcription antitermination factor NusB [Ichthyenterobacterium sp. W332]|uniref:Transcription antitermination factor NusB n=1 Tax=Microcosmobacter mediterraneus TaxID=3075607 RepID=A0ABU2YGG0_9FLAO|nr:transcription antitermination factor NusB [Ichthyenterobacterium sp. W332]MDT0557253.1 transcription antitermination factor NusB [Ichthyenterobacterium sp. W332]
MQTLYAFKRNEGDDFKADKTFLLKSLDGMYDLYLVLLALLIEIHKKAEDRLEKTQQKILATSEEKNPNRKFVNNEVLKLLSENKALNDVITSKKLNFWDLDFEYVDILLKAILKSDVYNNYMSKKVSSFKEDKEFVIDMYKEVIAPNDKLYDYIEDKKITWIDDLPIVNTNLLKILRKLKPNSKEQHLLPKLYKDNEDKEFAVELFQKSLLNKSTFDDEIGKKTTNWDSDRIASLDAVMLRMALCEFQKFPSIPVKVTINEYLEIAKEYSTPKSSIFINGVLDKTVKEYQSEGKLNKIGRGLM